MWKSAYIGIHKLLNWKMHGETLKKGEIMFMINLYSTCSTSYLLVGIYRIHLLTTAATDLKATIGDGVLSQLLYFGRSMTIHCKQTEYCHCKSSCPLVLMCNEKS